MTVFIGIDLAWRGDKNHSGGAVLYGDQRGVKVSEVSSSIGTLLGVKTFICKSDPPLIMNSRLHSFLGIPLDSLKGCSLKHYEDKLDAVFCAYLAAYFWAWGYERNEMIGNLETGYIINPRRTKKH
ncbi:MAG: hypothetical protein ACLQVL_23675 [Terriglobia bacterium]